MRRPSGPGAQPSRGPRRRNEPRPRTGADDFGIHHDRAFLRQVDLQQQRPLVWLLVSEIDEAAAEVQVVDEDGCLGQPEVISVKGTANANVSSCRNNALQLVSHRVVLPSGVIGAGVEFLHPEGDCNFPELRASTAKLPYQSGSAFHSHVSASCASLKISTTLPTPALLVSAYGPGRFDPRWSRCTRAVASIPRRGARPRRLHRRPHVRRGSSIRGDR